MVAKANKFGELKKRILFLIGALIVFRIGAHIPVPGIDPIQLAKKFKPDFLYLVTIRAASNINLETPFVMDMVDSMGLNLNRRLALEKGVKKWILHLEKIKVSMYEKMLANLSKKSFLVSNIDSNYLRSTRVTVLPLGVDCSTFFPKNSPPLIPTVIFTGNMNYQPNIDAITWFVANCWDRIRTFEQKVVLKIVGANPSSSVLKLASQYEGIFVTGRVESVALEINSSHVAIAPMQSGSGMQFKILEAMACGVPVVATKLGLGDIAAKSSYEIFLGDSAEEFSDHVLKLINSPLLRSEVGARSLEFVRSKHSWDAINKEFLLEISK